MERKKGFWKGRKVLVTGAMGFIGSHLSERLVEEGAVVRALGRYNSSGSVGWLEHSPHLENIETVLRDIRDQEAVRESCQGVDTVFHLAALIGIPYSYRAPDSYLQTNVQGTLNVLLAGRQHQVRRLIHTSTSEVYGTAQTVPIAETHPLVAQSPYAATKIAADKLVESFHLSFDFPAVTVRPFNTFGPRQSQRAVIPTIIAQAQNGSKVQLGKLTPTRDLNYVANTVDGFLAAAESEKAVGQTVNLGTGQEISIGALAELIFSLMGVQPDLETDSARLRPSKSEVERLVADSRLARELLDWQPRHSLREGLEKTIAWFGQRRPKARAYAV